MKVTAVRSSINKVSADLVVAFLFQDDKLFSQKKSNPKNWIWLWSRVSPSIAEVAEWAMDSAIMINCSSMSDRKLL